MSIEELTVEELGLVREVLTGTIRACQKLRDEELAAKLQEIQRKLSDGPSA